jgi:DNA-binding GntR family transcriptional regulator
MSDTILSLPPRTTLATEVVMLMREAIISGTFHPGAQLTESRIAEQLNISRGPVREAMRLLENEGLVVYSPHRGYSLRSLSLKDLEEVFQLRVALETLAVSLVIDRLDDKDLQWFEAIVSEMEALATTPDHIRATELDYRFHHRLCELSGNKRLGEVWNSLRAQLRVAVLAGNSSFPVYEGFAERHREVLDAIKSGRVGNAVSAVKSHIMAGFVNLRRELTAPGSAQPVGSA